MSDNLSAMRLDLGQAILNYCRNSQILVSRLAEILVKRSAEEQCDLPGVINVLQMYNVTIGKLSYSLSQDTSISKNDLRSAMIYTSNTNDICAPLEQNVQNNLNATDPARMIEMIGKLRHSARILYDALENNQNTLLEEQAHAQSRKEDWCSSSTQEIQTGQDQIIPHGNRDDDYTQSNNQDNPVDNGSNHPSKKSNKFMVKYVALPASVCSAGAAYYSATCMSHTEMLVPILDVNVNAAYTTAGVAGIICAISTIMILYYHVHKGGSIPSKDNCSTKLCNPQSNLYMSQDTMPEHSYSPDLRKYKIELSGKR